MQEREGAGAFGARYATLDLTGDLPCKVKASTAAKGKPQLQGSVAKEHAKAKLDVTQGNFTHPPFGRARPK